MRPTRRQFVQQMTALGFGSYLAIAAGCGSRRREGAVDGESGGPTASPGALRTFTPDQFRTLQAACERILPKDEDPGANDLGVPEYIDAVLATDMPKWRDVMVKLLPVLDRQTRRRLGGKLFHEVPPADQDGLLASWQKGASGEKFFFGVLMALTFEGAFGDPRYGGNRDKRGYAMVGSEPGPPMQKGMGGMKMPVVP